MGVELGVSKYPRGYEVGGALVCVRPNQLGKPFRRENPPGGNLSSSVADTVPPSCISVVYMYVVSGVMRG